jgi:leucine dehydrogenase
MTKLHNYPPLSETKNHTNGQMKNHKNRLNHTQAIDENSMSGVLSQMHTSNHEQVVFCHDKDTGLKAIIAIHNTVLGPSLGGTRMWSYASETDALTDVLRLSRGMTYKAAVAGLNLGGGKAVIIGDARKDKSEALMRRFGKFVESLNGKYITAEDVGISSRDMEYIRLETKNVTGLPVDMGGGGDPGPMTAYGVYLGIKAAAKSLWGNDSLSGKRIGVEGIGSVGYRVAEYLVKENAKVFACDLYTDRLTKINSELGVEIVATEDFYDQAMDIYTPCALGATINDKTLERLKCSIIAGSANNQLANEQVHAHKVIEKGILYIPDFVINAGGLINVYTELHGYNEARALANTDKIYQTILDVLKMAKDNDVTPTEASMLLAEKRIDEIAKIKATY